MAITPPRPPLTPETALENLKQIDALVSRVALTRNDHDAVKAAIQDLTAHFEALKPIAADG
jgi:hypothetical protein